MSAKTLLTPSVLQEASLALLIFAVSWFVVGSMRWPLVGDASLVHYVVLLMNHGMVPYRDIGDMNFPGAYFPDYVVTHTIGPSALAWRIYDLILLLLTGIAMIAIVGLKAWKTGLWGALLFAIIHGRDGLYQLGQRDLTMAALLLCAVAILLQQSDGLRLRNFFIFGLGVAAAGMIKPIGLPFIGVACPILWSLRRQRSPVLASLASTTIGIAFPLLLTFAWLMHIGALSAFVHSQRVLTVYHASLARRPVDFLLLHSFSPILPIVLAWILFRLISIAWMSESSDIEEALRNVKLTTLGLAIALGLLSYVIQGKGYPYHRYTFLAFLIIFLSIDLDQAFRRDKLLRWASALTLMTTAISIAIVSAVVIAQFSWRTQEFETSLEADLVSIGSSAGVKSLDNKVQCLDSISGCLTTLYDMNIPQTTGLIYDEFLFRPAGTVAVDETRRSFWHSVNATPPNVFILTSRLFPTGPDQFEKLSQWPEFAEWLKNNYRLAIKRDLMAPVRQGGPAFTPSGYQIYLRRGAHSRP